MSQVPAPDTLLPGKLPPADLAQALARLAPSHPRLLVGPRVGEDAAVVEMGQRRLVIASDPITFATQRVGWYAVHVNANDIAVMGAEPAWFFATVLLPEGTSRSAAHALLDEIGAACRELGITLSGGHTEITGAVRHAVVAGQMVGETSADALVTKAGLRPGDQVILTHGAAIEGTALLARELAPRLEPHLGGAMLARAQQLLFAPGISVVRAARIATAAARVHAMHDPTEGGVLAGLHELASAAGLGLRVSADRIAILPETREVCKVLGVDPLALIASGALLVATARDAAAAVLDALAAAFIPAAIVAEARPAGEGIVIERGDRAAPLEPPSRDEAARILDGT